MLLAKCGHLVLRDRRLVAQFRQLLRVALGALARRAVEPAAILFHVDVDDGIGYFRCALAAFLDDAETYKQLAARTAVDLQSRRPDFSRTDSRSASGLPAEAGREVSCLA